MGNEFFLWKTLIHTQDRRHTFAVTRTGRPIDWVLGGKHCIAVPASEAQMQQRQARDVIDNKRLTAW